MNVVKFYNTTYYLWNGNHWQAETIMSKIPSGIQNILGSPDDLKYQVKNYKNKNYFFDPEIFGYGKWKTITKENNVGAIAPESVQKALGGVKTFDIDKRIPKASSSELINDTINNRTQRYAKAERIRESGIGNIAYRMMMENKDKNIVGALKDAGKMVFKANTIDRLKEFIDPLNMTMKMTGSPLITAAVGRLFNRTNSDIKYFSEGKHTAYESMSGEQASSQQKIIQNRETALGIYKNSSIHDVLTKIYKLLYNWKSEELKREDLKDDLLKSEKNSKEFDSHESLLKSKEQKSFKSGIFPLLLGIEGLNWLYGWIKENKDQVRDFLEDLPKNFTIFIGKVQDTITNISKAIDSFLTMLPKLEEIVDFLDGIIDKLKWLGDKLDKLNPSSVKPIGGITKPSKEQSWAYPRNTKFILDHDYIAKKVSKELDIDFMDVMAKMLNETDFGNPDKIKGSHNFFGIKADKDWKGRTTEDGYKIYNSVQEMLDDIRKIGKSVFDNPGTDEDSKEYYNVQIKSMKRRYHRLMDGTPDSAYTPEPSPTKPSIHPDVPDSEIDDTKPNIPIPINYINPHEKYKKELETLKKIPEDQLDDELKKAIDAREQYIKNAERSRELIKSGINTPQLRKEEEKLARERIKLSKLINSIKIPTQSDVNIPNPDEINTRINELSEQINKYKDIKYEIAADGSIKVFGGLPSDDKYNKRAEELIQLLEEKKQLFKILHPDKPLSLDSKNPINLALDQTLQQNKKLQNQPTQPIIINNNNSSSQQKQKQPPIPQEQLTVRNDEPVLLSILSGNFQYAVG